MTTETEQFHIKQESFEGPIEVLLELIEKRKIFVNDISLAIVTDDFISYIQEKGMQPEHVSAFLSVAATLLLIKARSLLTKTSNLVLKKVNLLQSLKDE